jgi:hypothetical protein
MTVRSSHLFVAVLAAAAIVSLSPVPSAAQSEGRSTSAGAATTARPQLRVSTVPGGIRGAALLTALAERNVRTRLPGASYAGAACLGTDVRSAWVTLGHIFVRFYGHE